MKKLLSIILFTLFSFSFAAPDPVTGFYLMFTPSVIPDISISQNQFSLFQVGPGINSLPLGSGRIIVSVYLTNPDVAELVYNNGNQSRPGTCVLNYSGFRIDNSSCKYALVGLQPGTTQVVIGSIDYGQTISNVVTITP
jgi:hypothetical protein